MTAIFFYEGLIGRYALQDTDNTLTRMWLGDRITLVPEEIEIRETPLLCEAERQLKAYFAGKLREFNLPLAPKGTEFQLGVWNALCDIPYGTTLTYGQLADKLGNKGASRAVGMANSRNPLPVFIPCHRVMGAGGKLTGYTGGLEIKMKLLSLEGIAFPGELLNDCFNCV